MVCKDCGTVHPPTARFCMQCGKPFERAQMQLQEPVRANHQEYKQVPFSCKAKPGRINYEWHDRVNALVKEMGRDGWIPEYATDAETLRKGGQLKKIPSPWGMFGSETWQATIRFRRLVYE